MRFAKYEGIGNDFIMFADPEDRLELAPELVRRLCDRRFGVGADGVIRVAPGRDGGELFMDYVNSDGSLGEMCGNGIRCLAKYALDEGLTDSTELKVDTRAGVKVVKVAEGGIVTVDMGAPIFDPPAVPVAWDGPHALDATVTIGDDALDVTCLSVGNPHAVLFVDDVGAAPVRSLGPVLENHEMFPHKANVEFVRVLSPERIEMRVWERGSGETLACGTGASAAAVAARVVHGMGPSVRVDLPGGSLDVEWSGSLDHDAPIYMTGPTRKSFEGDVDLESYAE